MELAPGDLVAYGLATRWWGIVMAVNDASCEVMWYQTVDGWLVSCGKEWNNCILVTKIA